MKVVLDTNVIVSGTFWSGASFHIIKLVDEGKITLVVSPSILEEYDRILHSAEIIEKTTISQQARIQAFQKILTKAILLNPREKLKVITNDPDDDKFLEAAVAGDVKYLVSQDKKHLLILKTFRSIKIVSPEEFLKLFP